MALVREGTIYTLGHVLSIIFTIIMALIYIPMCCYGLYAYSQLSTNLIIKKRHYRISMIFGLLMIWLILLVCCIQLCLGWWITLDSASIWLFYPYLVISQMATLVFMLKVYLNYFDIHYSKEFINSKWKSLISSSYASEDQSRHTWYVSHRHTLGDSRFWVKYLLLACALQIVLVYALQKNLWPRDEYGLQSAEQLVFFQNAFLLPTGLLMAAFSVYVRCRTPEFDDVFLIRKEIMLCLCAWTLGLVCNGPLLFVFWCFVRDDELLDVVALLTMFLSASANCGIVWLSTLWSIAQNAKWLQLFGGAGGGGEGVECILAEHASHHSVTGVAMGVAMGRRDRERASTMTETSSPAEVEPSYLVNPLPLTTIADSRAEHTPRPGPGPGPGHLDAQPSTDGDATVIADQRLLRDILRSEDGVDCFMFHLAQEFSTEILLSLLEFAQFKAKLRAHFEVIDMLQTATSALDMHNPEQELVSFPASMPRSDIVWGALDSLESAGQIGKCLAAVAGDSENERALVEAKVRAHLLFRKYIEPKCESEINISAAMRERLCDKMEDVERWASSRRDTNFTMRVDLLYRVFDECMDEMLKLLTYSLVRFQHTSTFERFLATRKGDVLSP